MGEEKMYKKILVITLAFLMLAAMTLPMALAELITDKSDYAPTDPVNLTGTGFLSNSQVNLTLTGLDGFAEQSWSVMSDENGNINTTYSGGLADGNFTITATDGVTPTQTTTFTDPTPVTVLISVGVSPASVVAGSTVTFTVTISVPASNPPSVVYSAISSVELSIGTEWGTPTSVSAGSTGHTWDVDSTSAGIIDVSQHTGSDAIKPGESITVTFTVVVPSTTGLRTWSIEGWTGDGQSGNSNTQNKNVDVVALTVTKTANPLITRTYTWSVEKTADPATLYLDVDEQGSVDYKVKVDASPADTYSVSGTITITNPSEASCSISGVDDVVKSATQSDITVTVDPPSGGFPYTLNAGAHVDITYSKSLPDDTARTNTATAYVGSASFSSSAVAFDFTSATVTEVHKTVDVTDSWKGTLGSLTYGTDTLPHTYTYTRTIDSYSTTGEYTVSNTAYVKEDSTTLTSDQCDLTVEVEGSGLSAITSRGYELITTFKLIFTPDAPANPTLFRLTASNPGQFSYNVYYVATTGEETFTIKIPYPFVNQGANSVQIYNAAPDGYTPQGSVINSQFIISGVPWLIANWETYTFGATHEITITNDGYKGPMYITIHLDYGLKKVAGGYSRNLDNDNAYHSSTSPDIKNSHEYDFIVSGSYGDTASVSNVNVFKHDPGIGGLILGNDGSPIAGATVKIYQGKTLYATAYTDADGWYMCNFKYTGKATSFTVKVAGFADQTVTLKSNGFAVVNFGVT
jgi:hypothetical protein